MRLKNRCSVFRLTIMAFHDAVYELSAISRTDPWAIICCAIKQALLHNQFIYVRRPFVICVSWLRGRYFYMRSSCCLLNSLNTFFVDVAVDQNRSNLTCTFARAWSMIRQFVLIFWQVSATLDDVTVFILSHRFFLHFLSISNNFSSFLSRFLDWILVTIKCNSESIEFLLLLTR